MALIFGMPAVLGLLVLEMVFLTHGIGISKDTTGYFSLAENLRSGNGHALSITMWEWHTDTMPYGQWPPLYPLLLALPVFAPIGVVAEALNLVLFAASIVLVCWSVYKYTQSRYAALFAGFALALSPSMFRIYDAGLSEAPYIFLLVAGFALLQHYLLSPRFSYLISMSAVFAAAALTRYFGLAAIAACAISIVLYGQSNRASRIKDTAVFSAVALFPSGLWMIRNLLLTSRPTGQWNGPDIGITEYAAQCLNELAGWFIPSLLPSLMSVLLILLLLGATAYWLLQLRRRIPALPPVFPRHLMSQAVFVAVHIIFILGLSLAVPTDGTADRYLAPILPALITIAAAGLHYTGVISSRHPFAQKDATWKLVLVVAVLSLIVFPAINLARNIIYIDFKTEGIGYKAARWRDLDIVHAVTEKKPPFNSDPRIYSNAADVLHYYGGGPTTYLPGSADALEQLYRETISNSGIVVMLHINDTLGGQIQEDILQSSPLFRVAATFNSGTIYEPVNR